MNDAKGNRTKLFTLQTLDRSTAKQRKFPIFPKFPGKKGKDLIKNY